MMFSVLDGRLQGRFRPPPWPNPIPNRPSTLGFLVAVGKFLRSSGLLSDFRYFVMPDLQWFGMFFVRSHLSPLRFFLPSINSGLRTRFEHTDYLFSSRSYTVLLSLLNNSLSLCLFAMDASDKAKEKKPTGVSSFEPLSNTPRKGPKPSNEEKLSEGSSDLNDGGRKTRKSKDVSKNFKGLVKIEDNKLDEESFPSDVIKKQWHTTAEIGV